MQNNPDIIAIRKHFQQEKENKMRADELEKPPKIKIYLFGSIGKNNIIPMKLFLINGFMDWFYKNKKDLLDIYISENDIQNLIDEFNN
jgi:hypothetical protein